jgi:hypothetical protein
MTDIKYICIDESDAYRTSVSEYESKESMLDGIRFKDLSEIKVYEVSKRVRLAKQIAVVEQ